MRACKVCGWVKGATSGYPSLTNEERAQLLSRGYTMDRNAIGEEVARPAARSYYNSARFELHQVLCLYQTWLERL